MVAATTPKRLKEKTRLLKVSNKSIEHSTVDHFIDFLAPGDLIVVNRSATLPSSFRGRLDRTGDAVEIRLAAFQGPDPSDLRHWQAFIFGKGDWQVPTERRHKPPEVKVGDQITIGKDLSIAILECSFTRLLKICFSSTELHKNLYKHGKPIQYSYLIEELAVWDQQTIFSGPPISVEPPSASFPFTWDLIFKLQAKGIMIADVLHGAGISSTGSDLLDKTLPLAEWYDIPHRTAKLFTQTKNSRSKIISIGTSALRALETAWNGNVLVSGSGLTQLKISPNTEIQTIDGIVTGMHEEGTSHMDILASFCGNEQITQSYNQANTLGYRSHEYGDLTFLNCKKSR